jgi:hypothetical protein
MVFQMLVTVVKLFLKHPVCIELLKNVSKQLTVDIASDSGDIRAVYLLNTCRTISSLVNSAGFSCAYPYKHLLTVLLKPHYGPEDDSTSNRNEYKESSCRVKGGLPARKAENLTAICESIV